MNKISSEQNLTPLQPELLKQSSYRETFVNWNTACIKSGAIFYEFETGKDAQLIRLIPDACPDFSFQITDHDVNAIVFGIQQDAIEVSLAPHSRYFGFKPFSCNGSFLQQSSWQELFGKRVSFNDLFKNHSEVLFLLQNAKSYEERIEVIQSFAKENMVNHNYYPGLAEHIEETICTLKGNIQIEDITEQTNYSSRYCREKFTEANGISIKKYAEIMRNQNVVRMLLGNPDSSLLDIAYENNYFDQAHMTHAFSKYAGASPVKFRNMYSCI